MYGTCVVVPAGRRWVVRGKEGKKERTHTHNERISSTATATDQVFLRFDVADAGHDGRDGPQAALDDLQLCVFWGFVLLFVWRWVSDGERGVGRGEFRWKGEKEKGRTDRRQANKRMTGGRTDLVDDGGAVLVEDGVHRGEDDLFRHARHREPQLLHHLWLIMVVVVGKGSSVVVVVVRARGEE